MKVDLDPRSENLVAQQLRTGRFHTPEEVVARALETLAGDQTLQAGTGRRSAVEDMLAFAGEHRFTLGAGVGLQDLIREGRKH